LAALASGLISRPCGTRPSARGSFAYEQPQRTLAIGIGTPVGTGKTALMNTLCRAFRDIYQVAAITIEPLILELNLRRAGTTLSTSTRKIFAVRKL
jgi:hypothetical protein